MGEKEICWNKVLWVEILSCNLMTIGYLLAKSSWVLKLKRILLSHFSNFSLYVLVKIPLFLVSFSCVLPSDAAKVSFLHSHSL